MLKRAGVPHFPIYTLRHVFCTASAKWPRTRLYNAPCGTPALNQARYQLGMTEQVRQAVEKANKKPHGQKRVLRFYDILPDSDKEQKSRR